mmetsp:Transcript_16301/g.35439  ORF Transcript_16301/g.35439 Transcript_16301/m.35439 type:complete len:215 (+) Transcript_16301:687-1331(+)
MHDAVAAHLGAPKVDARGAAGEVAPVSGIRHHRVAPLPLRHTHHLHEAVEEAVHHLEAGGGPAEERGGAADVLGADVLGRVELHHVRHLEDLHRQGGLLVAAQRLQQPRHQRRAHALEVDGLGVADERRLVDVRGAVHQLKVVALGPQDPRQHLREPGHRHLVADQIREAVHRQLLAHGDCLGHGHGEVVEAVGNGDILHDVAGVQHVAARGGH